MFMGSVDQMSKLFRSYFNRIGLTWTERIKMKLIERYWDQVSPRLHMVYKELEEKAEIEGPKAMDRLMEGPTVFDKIKITPWEPAIIEWPIKINVSSAQSLRIAATSNPEELEGVTMTGISSTPAESTTPCSTKSGLFRSLRNFLKSKGIFGSRGGKS